MNFWKARGSGPPVFQKQYSSAIQKGIREANWIRRSALVFKKTSFSAFFSKKTFVWEKRSWWRFNLLSSSDPTLKKTVLRQSRKFAHLGTQLCKKVHAKFEIGSIYGRLKKISVCWKKKQRGEKWSLLSWIAPCANFKSIITSKGSFTRRLIYLAPKKIKLNWKIEKSLASKKWGCESIFIERFLSCDPKLLFALLIHT